MRAQRLSSDPLDSVGLRMSDDVYITGLGRFLPGPPIPNDEMEDYLGRIGGKPSRARVRVLAQNGIRTRHYAIDKQQRTLYRNSEMAALAVRDALGRAGVELSRIEFLAAATTQGDLLVPGFASMVHGELKNPPCEIATLHGICASGVMALKSAFLQVKAEQRRVAVACASELPSRLFKASRFERQGADRLPFETEFLRWMLSDGAGAAVLQDRPREDGLSLRIDWVELRSHANRYPVCMFAGANQAPEGELGPSWLDFQSFEAASREGAMNLRQDIRLLDQVVKLGVDGFFELCDRGRVDPSKLDHIVCHHSSEFFRTKIFDLLARGGLTLPAERWFTNLYTRGNVGSASLFVLLEELLNGTSLKAGQQVFCIIPESGRFSCAYALLTVVESESATRSDGSRSKPAPPPLKPPEAPRLSLGDGPLQAAVVRGLTRAFIDFETRLHEVPVVRRIETLTLDVEGYRQLLVNLRQQVVEGSRWIARAASNVSDNRFDLRALFLQHAKEESRDFQMLERDFVSVGGALEEIQNAPKNIGSEALSAWMFHKASAPNPFDLLGAMFIIEGLGARMANGWGELIRDGLGLRDDQVSFLLYHGKNDDTHFGKLEAVLGSGLLDAELVERIVKTAKVTARLYLLQLEELGAI